MARGKLGLGVELAGDEARLVLVESSDKGLVVRAAQTVRAGDDLARAFRSLPGRPAGVVCAVGLEQAAVRILSLPPTVEENLERVVMLEAETVLPLAPEELALSHHVMGMTDLSRLEVLLAAARQSEVQRVLRRVNCLPWVSAAVTVTVVALQNAVEELRAGFRESNCAVIRVEEEHSELVVLERGRLFTAQSLQVGCGDPAAVRGEVLAAAGGARGPAYEVEASGPPAWTVDLAQQIRYALQSVSYERGVTAERLYVCGRGADQPEAVAELSRRLGVTVSPLTVGATTADSPVYAVAYGCAAQAAGLASVPLNLTPARVAVAREVEQRRQTRVSWGALAGAVAVAGILVAGAMFHSREVELEQVQKRLDQLGGASARPAVSAGDLNTASKALDAALATRVSAAEALATLSRNLPPGTWLAELAYNTETGCVVRGYSTAPDGAQRAQIALLQQRVFDEVTLDYRTQEQIGPRPVWGFQFSCKLRPPEQVRRRR
jgi:hypothetical protein